MTSNDYFCLQKDHNPKLPNEKIEPKAKSTTSNAKFDDNFDVSFIFFTLATDALLSLFTCEQISVTNLN